jgi:hypothetical protein
LAVVVVAVDVAYLPRAPSAFGIRQFPYRVFQATTSLNLSYHVGVLAMSGAMSARKCRASTQVSRQLNSLEYSRRSLEEVAGPRVAGGPPFDLNPARRGAGTVPLGRAKGSGQSLSIVRPVSLWTLRGLKRARACALRSAQAEICLRNRSVARWRRAREWRRPSGRAKPRMRATSLVGGRGARHRKTRVLWAH